MSRRIADLQVLRAIAILAVVALHAQGDLSTPESPYLVQRLWSYFAGGYGVDLFFVISGFIIARSLIPDVVGRTRTEFVPVAVNFWARRAVRLLPAAWFWLAVPCALSLLFNRSGSFGKFADNYAGSITAILQVANVHFAFVFGGSHPEAVFPYWSLSLEEQFYLVLPPFLLVAGRRLLPVLVLVLGSQLFVERLMLHGPFRITGLVLGVLLALAQVQGILEAFEPSFLAGRPGLGLAAFALMGLCVFTLGGEALHTLSSPWVFNMAAVASAVLVWVASYDRDYLFPRGRVKNVLVAIGDRSYSMYLTHVPAIFTAREIVFRWKAAHEGSPVPRGTWLVLATTLLLVFTELTYRLLEKRIQRELAPGLATLASRVPRRPSPGAGPGTTGQASPC